MSLLVWVLVGAATGVVADLAGRGYGILEDVIVGVVGSVAAGWIFFVLSSAPVTSVSPFDAASALVGATAFIALSRGLTRNRGAI